MDEHQRISAAYALERIRHSIEILRACGIDGKIINLLMIGLSGARKSCAKQEVKP